MITTSLDTREEDLVEEISLATKLFLLDLMIAIQNR